MFITREQGVYITHSWMPEETSSVTTSSTSFCPARDVAHGVTSESPITDSEVDPGERGEMNADEEGSSEEEDDDKTGEEARKVHKRRHCDGPPTERERVDHARTHLLYRTWCPACVAGRGRASPRPRSPQDETVGEMVAYDYCFFGMVPMRHVHPLLWPKIGGQSC